MSIDLWPLWCGWGLVAALLFLTLLVGLVRLFARHSLDAAATEEMAEAPVLGTARLIGIRAVGLGRFFVPQLTGEVQPVMSDGSMSE